MCRNISKNKRLKGDVDMNTTVNNLDYALAELIKNNKESSQSLRKIQRLAKMTSGEMRKSKTKTTFDTNTRKTVISMILRSFLY